MSNKNSTELLERLRTDIHAVADLICDMIEVNMDWELGLVTIKAGQGIKNSNDIARQRCLPTLTNMAGTCIPL